MLEVTHISAFLGGLFTFLAPCTLPMIPAYISYIGGTSDEHISGGNTAFRFRLAILRRAFAFVLGFSTIFVLFGVASGALGGFFVIHRAFLARLGGMLIILFGFSMLGIVRFPALPASLPFKYRAIPHWLKPQSSVSAYILGLLFGLGWSPCLGPILGTILALSGVSGSAGEGAILLLTYAAGIGVPFLLIAFFYGSSYKYLARTGRLLPYIKIAGAALFITIGFLMAIGQFGMLNALGAGFYNEIGVEELFDRM